MIKRKSTQSRLNSSVVLVCAVAQGCAPGGSGTHPEAVMDAQRIVENVKATRKQMQKGESDRNTQIDETLKSLKRRLPCLQRLLPKHVDLDEKMRPYWQQCNADEIALAVNLARTTEGFFCGLKQVNQESAEKTKGMHDLWAKTATEKLATDPEKSCLVLRVLFNDIIRVYVEMIAQTRQKGGQR